MLAVFECQSDSSTSVWTNSVLNELFLQQQTKNKKTSVDPPAVIRFVFELAFAIRDVRSDVSPISSCLRCLFLLGCFKRSSEVNGTRVASLFSQAARIQ